MVIATCVETPTRFRRYTVAEATNIPKGTILKMTSPSTAIASSATNDPFAGIAWEEFKGGEGLTQITAAANGVWLIASTAAAVGVGQPVAIGGADAVRAAIEADTVLGDIVGKSETTVSGSGGTLRVIVGEVI
jgi:hypothetical protein